MSRWAFTLEPPPLYFAHIPKTSGVSLFVFLRDSYGRRRTFPMMVRQEFLLSSPEKRQKCRLFVGHWGLDIEALLPPGALWMTVLRDPVEQTMSWFYHMQTIIPRYPEAYTPLARWQPVVENDLPAALDSPFIVAQLANQQTRFLATAVDYAPFASPGEWETYDTLTAVEPPMEEVYQRALTHLTQMAAVGVTERFNDTVKIVCHLLGLLPPWVQPHYNLNKRREKTGPAYYRQQLSPTRLQQLEALIAYDRRLYEVAQQRLNEQMGEVAHSSRRVWAIRPFFRQIFYSAARLAWQPFRR
jgi:hypothetical protein